MDSQQSSNGSSSDCRLDTPLRGARPCCLATPSPVTRVYPEDSEDEAKGWAICYDALRGDSQHLPVKPLPNSASVVPPLVRALTSMASLGTRQLSETAAPPLAGPNPVAVQVVVAESIALQKQLQPKETDQLQKALQSQLGQQPPARLVLAQQIQPPATPMLALLTPGCIGTAPSPAQPGLDTCLTVAAPVVAAHLHAEALLKATASSRMWQQQYHNQQLHLGSLPQPPLLMPTPCLLTSGLLPAMSVPQTEVAQPTAAWPDSGTVIGMLECSRMWQQQQCPQQHVPSQPQLSCLAPEHHIEARPALPGTFVPGLIDALACSRHWLQHPQPSLQEPCNQEQHQHSIVSALGSETDLRPPTMCALGSLLGDRKEASALSQQLSPSEPDKLCLSSVGTSCSSLSAPMPEAVASVAEPCRTEATSGFKQAHFFNSWEVVTHQLGRGCTQQLPAMQQWVAPVAKPKTPRPKPAAFAIPGYARNLAVCAAAK